MEQLASTLFLRSPYIVPGLPSKKQIDQLIERVASKFNLTVEEIKEKTRKRNVVDARATAFYLIKNKMPISWAACAEPFGLDHATAMHGYRVFETQYSVNKKFRNRVADLLC